MVVGKVADDSHASKKRDELRPGLELTHVSGVDIGQLVSKNDEFCILKTKNCVAKTRNCALKWCILQLIAGRGGEVIRMMQVSFQWKNPDFLFSRILISYFQESRFPIETC